MPKESGIGMTAAIDNGSGAAKTITDDITDLSIAIPRAVQDVTGLADAAPERLLLLADMAMTVNGVFNDATDLSHDVFKTVPSQGPAQTRLVTITVSGQIFTAETFATDYILTRAADGALTWSVPFVNADGNIPAWA